MGQSSSKLENQQPYVFTNATSIRISESLLRQLEESVQPPSSSNPSSTSLSSTSSSTSSTSTSTSTSSSSSSSSSSLASTPSPTSHTPKEDFVPKSQVQSYINDQVEKRLQIELERLRTNHQHASTHLETLHAQTSLRDSQTLIDSLDKKRSIELSTEYLQAKNLVSQCYLNNPNKPLNCSEEVDYFKTTVSKMQEQFLKTF